MISLRDISRAWNRFFFEPVSPLPMAAYRILLGLLILANQLLLLPDVNTWFGPRGTLTFATGLTVSGGSGFSLFSWLPHNSAVIWLIYLSSCLFAALLAAGLFTRFSAAMVFLLIVTLNHRNPLILNGGDTFLRIATFFTIFSAGGKAVSLDRWLALKRGRASAEIGLFPPWAMRMIQVQLTFLYLYAFVWKVTGNMWMNGTAVFYTARLVEFQRFPVPYVFEHMWTIKIWTWATLVIELALGSIVWIKELRYPVLLSGVLLHAGIDYSMNIPLFAFIMIFTYVTFVEPAHIHRILSRLLPASFRALLGPDPAGEAPAGAATAP